VRAACDYALRTGHEDTVAPFFGLIVSQLWEQGVTSDTAITEWVEAAEDGAADARVRALLASKWTQWLLSKLDEDDDDDEEEDDDDDEDDDEDEEGASAGEED
jgi:hypothetical protein